IRAPGARADSGSIESAAGWRVGCQPRAGPPPAGRESTRRPGRPLPGRRCRTIEAMTTSTTTRRVVEPAESRRWPHLPHQWLRALVAGAEAAVLRSEEHTSELQSRFD